MGGDQIAGAFSPHKAGHSRVGIAESSRRQREVCGIEGAESGGLHCPDAIGILGLRCLGKGLVFRVERKLRERVRRRARLERVMAIRAGSYVQTKADWTSKTREVRFSSVS
jgi:hypothetical protein